MKNLDIWIYGTLSLLLAAYAFYLRATCEELGCLAVIIPIIGIFFLAGAELIVSIIIIFTKEKRKISLPRLIVFILSGLITAFAVITYIIGFVN